MTVEIVAMENISIEATERAPAISFDFVENRFLIKGESYPEDIKGFYGPLIDKLEAHLEAQDGAHITFEFDLVYFNSSSAKVLMGLFDTLDEVAGAGNTVDITWHYEEGDDNAQEFGEEFAEDLENAAFTLKETPLD